MFLISDAMAATAASAGATHQGGMGSFVFIIGFFVIFYFMMIRPQMKRAKEQKQLLGALAKDDEVMTTGGILGRISDVDDDFVSLEIADGTTIKLSKRSVEKTLPKGTL